MKLTLNYCTINDVMMVDPKKGDDQKKNRKVILHVMRRISSICSTA